jgi:hypothetical protein
VSASIPPSPVPVNPVRCRICDRAVVGTLCTPSCPADPRPYRAEGACRACVLIQQMERAGVLDAGDATCRRHGAGRTVYNGGVL